MKTPNPILMAALLLAGSTARANVSCEFHGWFGKGEEIRCTAEITETCNAPGKKVEGGSRKEDSRVCRGFEVRCDGEKINRKDSACLAWNTQEKGSNGVAQFLYSDFDTSCTHPTVIFDSPLPFPEHVHARLYLPDERVLFGACRIEGAPPTLPR